MVEHQAEEHGRNFEKRFVEYYDNTKLVHGNGLILYNYNLNGTKYDYFTPNRYDIEPVIVRRGRTKQTARKSTSGMPFRRKLKLIISPDDENVTSNVGRR